MLGHPATPPKAPLRSEPSTPPPSHKARIDTSWMDGIDTTGIDVQETLSGENLAKDILDFLEGLGLAKTKVKEAAVQPSSAGTKTKTEVAVTQLAPTLTPAETRLELSRAFTVWALQNPSVRKRNRVIFLS